MKQLLMLAVSAATVLLAAINTQAAVTTYSNDLAGFNMAAGNPPVAVTFDAIAPTTNIGGTALAGVTFNALGAPLIVVNASTTFSPPPGSQSNKLIATTLDNVLSPGGTELGFVDPAVENDDLELIFAAPIRSFGFDHLSQSRDGFSHTSVSVYDSGGTTLFGGIVPIVGSTGGGRLATTSGALSLTRPTFGGSSSMKRMIMRRTRTQT